ncbi:glycosyltransferase [Mammaliicoccus sciuri]|uniref:glycosyltransferase n=1 Tax=Mammaliicoccus sciuri TaxID=1296 RepID=UPI0034DCE446
MNGVNLCYSKSKKLFSIIVTTYNNEAKVERAIDSILNQSLDEKRNYENHHSR